MLAVACSALSRHGSREVSISECDITWRTVKVELLSSRKDYYFSIVSCMSLLFQLQGQYCFSLTKTMNYPAFIWN